MSSISTTVLQSTCGKITKTTSYICVLGFFRNCTGNNEMFAGSWDFLIYSTAFARSCWRHKCQLSYLCCFCSIFTEYSIWILGFCNDGLSRYKTLVLNLLKTFRSTNSRGRTTNNITAKTELYGRKPRCSITCLVVLLETLSKCYMLDFSRCPLLKWLAHRSSP
jgi:hypothetical protein